jgi:DNA-binding transcriptional ArsR family regulator
MRQSTLDLPVWPVSYADAAYLACTSLGQIEGFWLFSLYVESTYADSIVLLVRSPPPRPIIPFASNRFPVARRKSICYILNHMVQYDETRLDASFAALSDATRRGVLEQLSRADASITDLAGKFHMTLTGMKKHVAVLERAALVTTEKAGRVRTCRLAMRALEEEAAWIERHRQLWSARFDELDKIVEHLKSKEKADARRKRR